MPTEADMRQQAINKNYEAFKAKLPSIIDSHRGKFALIKDEEIIEYFDTAKDALLAAQKLYGNEVFSIQEVTDAVIDLGYYSHAVPKRTTH